MNDTKHTPGPWVVTGYDEEFQDQINIQNERLDYFVAAALDCKAVVANARLIAAAPDLLEALQALLADPGRDFIRSSAWDKARAAITKATGE